MTSITTMKGYILSTIITFIAVFLTVVCTQLQLPGFTFSKTSLTALVISALISGVRAIAKLIGEWAAGVVTNPVPPASQ